MFQGFRFRYPYSRSKNKASNVNDFFNPSSVPGKAMISKPNLALNRNVSCFIVVFEIAEL